MRAERTPQRLSAPREPLSSRHDPYSVKYFSTPCGTRKIVPRRDDAENNSSTIDAFARSIRDANAKELLLGTGTRGTHVGDDGFEPPTISV